MVGAVTRWNRVMPSGLVYTPAVLEVVFEFPLYIYRQGATLLAQVNLDVDEKKEPPSGDYPQRPRKSDVPICRSAGDRR